MASATGEAVRFTRPAVAWAIEGVGCPARGQRANSRFLNFGALKRHGQGEARYMNVIAPSPEN